MRAPDVSRPDACNETELGGIGDVDRFLLAVHADDREHWSGDLFLRDPHLAVDVSKHSGRYEEAATLKGGPISDPSNAGPKRMPSATACRHSVSASRANTSTSTRAGRTDLSGRVEGRAADRGGSIRVKHEAHGFGREPLDYRQVDFAQIARSSGTTGATATTDDELYEALEHALAREATTLIDVKVTGREYGRALAAVRG